MLMEADKVEPEILEKCDSPTTNCQFPPETEGLGIAWTWNRKEWLPNPILMRTLEVAKGDIDADIEGTCALKLKTCRFSLSSPHNLLFLGADI